LEYPRHLFRRRHELDVMAAFSEKLLRVGLLEIAEPDLEDGI
jgi:hypothetical protein